MRMAGLNTYDSTQIDDNESKYNLNCYNKEGLLTGYNYNTNFNIPNVTIYQREYLSNFFNAAGKNSVISGSPRYLHENDDVEITSGIVKPDVSLFVDTTKFNTGENSNYVRKADEFNNNYVSVVGDVRYPLIGNELFNAISNYGTQCEVYRDVEVAVSYSGAYGESGLTKFRIGSNILHFFLIVHGMDEYVLNPSYKYVNVYVRFAAYTELQLLYRLEISEVLRSTQMSMNIKTDTTDRRFYMTYNNDSIYELDSNDNLSTIGDIALINSDKETSSIIYSGLFQFEDESAVNPSWFISQKVVPQTPLADVETHTYISSEDYDIERNVNEYLDSRYQFVDSIAALQVDIPYITYDTNVTEFIDNEGVIYSDLFPDFNQLKFSKRNWINGRPDVKDYQKSNMDSGRDKTADIYGEALNLTLLKPQSGYYSVSVSDLYSVSNYPYGTQPGKLNHRDTGTFIIQYWVRDPFSNERTLVRTSEMTFEAVKYFTMSFNDIVSAAEDSDIYWQLDIWCVINSGDVSTGNYYRVMSIDVRTAYDAVLANLGGEVNLYNIADEDELLRLSIPYCKSNIGFTGDDRTFPLRDYGCYINTTTNTKGMFLVFNIGTILSEVDTYKTGLFGPISQTYYPLSDPVNYSDNIEDLLYNPDGRGEDSYNTYKDGIVNRPKQESPIWNVDVRHIEEYDGRLFMSSKERRTNSDILDLVDIVAELPTSPSDGDIYGIDNGIDNSTIQMYEDSIGWSKLGGAISIVLNKSTNTYYKFITDPVERDYFKVYIEYTPEYKDLYYSQQGYPEMVLETNYKGYDSIITGLKNFISQLYVFQEDRISIIRKSLTREVSGIIEPTYQYDKSFDMGAIEWTIAEYEKKVYFTNSDGIFYIDAGGNYNKISNNINRLFIDGYITPNSVDYATIKDEFYILKLKDTIAFNVFSELDISYADSRLLYCEYIAYHTHTDSFWMGNDVTGESMWYYMTKDYPKRNEYESEFLMKQNKRISFSYRDGIMKFTQIRNAMTILGEAEFGKARFNLPQRHTLSGSRCATYSILISSEFKTRVRDFMLLENGK